MISEQTFVQGNQSTFVEDVESGAIGIGVPSVKDVSENGVVGMNHAQVKLYVTIFQEGVNKFLNELDEVPINIAFYDPNGDLQASYRNEINKMRNKITEIFDSARKDIGNALDEEIDTILLAKENATDVLTTNA